MSHDDVVVRMRRNIVVGVAELLAADERGEERLHGRDKDGHFDNLPSNPREEAGLCRRFVSPPGRRRRPRSSLSPLPHAIPRKSMRLLPPTQKTNLHTKKTRELSQPTTIDSPRPKVTPTVTHHTQIDSNPRTHLQIFVPILTKLAKNRNAESRTEIGTEMGT